MLKVTVASTESEWAWPEDVGEDVGLPTEDLVAESGRLSRMIGRASRSVATYLDRPLGVATYEETLPGMGRNRLMLSRYPVRAVTAIFEGTDTGAATDLTTQIRLEDAEAGILSRDGGFAWTAAVLGRSREVAVPLMLTPLPGEETRPYLVRYVAGWTLNGMTTSSPNYTTGTAMSGTTSTGRTLPEDIEHAVGLRAATMFNGGESVEREKLGDLEVNYRSDGKDPSLDLLAPYVRVGR